MFLSASRPPRTHPLYRHPGSAKSRCSSPICVSKASSTPRAAQVRFARRRFGHFEVIDFVAILFGYESLGERTLEAFYTRLRPWAGAFLALFARDRLPSRSALSRWLAALDE